MAKKVIWKVEMAYLQEKYCLGRFASSRAFYRCSFALKTLESTSTAVGWP